MSTQAQEGPLASLFPDDPFTGFGPSLFFPTGVLAIAHRCPGRTSAAFHKDVRAAAPRSPGVYGMLDARGRVIYIGKAKNLRARLLCYFRTGSRDPKAGRIIKHTRTLLWEHAADEFAALLRELELIRRFRPRFNVVGQPGREQQVYLCLGREPAAYAYLSQEPKKNEVAVFGPFRGRNRMTDAVRRLNLHFGLRDCPSTTEMSFADQGQLFEGERTARCLRYELGTCLGPCGGFCDRRDYAAAVRAARAFLDGRDPKLLKEIQRQMVAAATEMNYERAAVLRDKLEALTTLSERLTFLRAARTSTSFIYPITSDDGQTRWYLIHGGQVRAVIREPSDAATAAAARAAIDHIFDAKRPGTAVRERCVDSVLIVTGWFRKRADEKARLLTAKAALAACLAFDM